jgi:hypothetical protein
MMLTVHPAAVNGDWGKRAQPLARPLLNGARQLFRPTGKEIVMRTLMVLLTLALFTTALVGCRVEGEVGEDAHTSVPSPR